MMMEVHRQKLALEKKCVFNTVPLFYLLIILKKKSEDIKNLM